MIEQQQTEQDVQRTADMLAGDICNAAFDDLANIERAHMSLAGTWTGEDPEQSGRDPEEFPLVVIDSTGHRYSVEVEVTVHPLGVLVDDQQPTYRTNRVRISTLNTVAWIARQRRDSSLPNRPQDALLTLSRHHCTACDKPLVEQWLSFPDASREGEVHADCEHFARLRDGSPEAFRDLGFAHVSTLGLPEVLETAEQVDEVAQRYGFDVATRTDGLPSRWAHRAVPPLELVVVHDDKAVRVAVNYASALRTPLVPRPSPVEGDQLCSALVEVFAHHRSVTDPPRAGAAERQP